MDRNDLIGKVLEIAGNYRKGEIAKFDTGHVERWINQFPVSEQHKNVILFEIGHMLEKYYISRETAKVELSRIFKLMKEEKAAGCSIREVNFLRTQDVGKSQDAILQLSDEILQEKVGMGTADCGGSKVYLYLDDCIYSGNKWRYDIRDSVQLAQAGKGITLVSYHFAIYNAGYRYAKPYVDSCMSQKGTVKPFRRDWLNNDCSIAEQLDILWPTYVQGNKQIDAYVSHANSYAAARNWSSRISFRSSQITASNVFTSHANQNIVEQAFLAVGAKMFCAAASPAPSVRPMGFQVLPSIGFGTPIVTWRNIANNCPMALWYGNPEKFGPTHPLGMWYPLFPRKM